MEIISLIGDFNALWIFLIAMILVYAGLIKLKIPGSNWIIAVLSLLIAMIFLTNDQARHFATDIIPSFAAILIVSVLLLLTLIFAATKIEIFQKPIAWIIFIAVLLVIIFTIFHSFPTAYHMLPDTSDSHLNGQMVEVKDYIYSSEFRENFWFVLGTISVFLILVLVKAK
jgi:FlaA1/EpsC-like NDP-sugar epimerase